MQLASDHGGKQEVAGVVMLAMPFSQTGPFREGIEKLLVSANWRRRGIARALLGILEGVARERGRTLLVSLYSVGRCMDLLRQSEMRSGV